MPESFTLPRCRFPMSCRWAERYDANYVYLSATFQAGSLNQADLGFVFFLDVDQDPLTGLRDEGFPYGVDYWVYFSTAVNRSEASVLLMSPYSQAGTVPISFGTDSLSARVPLVFLNDDDGIMNFGFAVGEPDLQSGVVISDFAPDVDVPGMALTATTTPVPEPPSMGFGILALALARFQHFRVRHAGLKT